MGAIAKYKKNESKSEAIVLVVCLKKELPVETTMERRGRVCFQNNGRSMTFKHLRGTFLSKKKRVVDSLMLSSQKERLSQWPLCTSQPQELFK